MKLSEIQSTVPEHDKMFQNIVKYLEQVGMKLIGLHVIKILYFSIWVYCMTLLAKEGFDHIPAFLLSSRNKVSNGKFF